MDKVIEIDENGKVHLPDTADAPPEIPCIQKGCRKPSGHKGRHTDGTLPGHVTAPPPSDAAQPTGESEAMQQLSRAVRAALSEIPGFTASPVTGTPGVKPKLSATAMLGMQDAFLEYVTAIGVEMLDERKDGNRAEGEGP